VGVDRTLADRQRHGNLFVRAALRNKSKHVALTGCQAASSRGRSKRRGSLLIMRTAELLRDHQHNASRYSNPIHIAA
jgi:hypothetical protein